jgi:Holliday junction DNA helicase RuvB
LASPFRDRFGIVHRLEFYSKDEIEKVVQRTAKIMKLKIDPAASKILADRSRLTPRIANRLLRRARDYATVHGDGNITKELVDKVFEHLQIDEKGLDITDRELLKIIINNYNGGPVGVETIGAILSEDRSTIEDYYEPFLLQIGFLERTPRGRKTTKAASDHLGYTMKNK